MKKPNILLLVCDTVRCDAMSCMGGCEGVTPNLDRLASDGVLFTDSYSVAPVCQPARSSLITGTYPKVHLNVENGMERLTDIPNFPDLLKEQGYRNIMIGKTHFGEVPASFDVQYLLNGEKNAENDDCYGQFAHAHGYKRKSEPPFDKPEEYCLDCYLADTAVRELGNQSRDDPFFMFVSFPSPHGPIDPPQKYVDKFRDMPLPPVNYTEGEEKQLPETLRYLLGLSQKDELTSGYGKAGTEFDEAKGSTIRADRMQELDEFRRKYYALMNYCDAQIGKIIDALKANGMYEDTLVIFTSDHGQQYFDHGFNDKHNFFDASWRVPLIMTQKNTLPAGETRSFATTLDVTASILGAAGTSCDTMYGLDQYTPLKNGEPCPRTAAMGMLMGYTGLVTEKYKLDYYFAEMTGHLFDRKTDPMEQHNLFDDPACSGVRNHLLEVLLSWHGSVENQHYLKKHSVGTGPVAKRAAAKISRDSAPAIEQRYQAYANA